jgi:hypothetical protein
VVEQMLDRQRPMGAAGGCVFDTAARLALLP